MHCYLIVSLKHPGYVAGRRCWVALNDITAVPLLFQSRIEAITFAQAKCKRGEWCVEEVPHS
jgi:hypothetical protein